MVAEFDYKILIVDDSQDDRVIYHRYLNRETRYTYQVIEAESVSEALELYDRNLPDLVVLDYQLPDDDGMVFLRKWQQLYKNTLVPVVMLTGNENATAAVEAMKLGVQDYWIKSHLTSDFFCQGVRTALEQIQLKRQLFFQQEQQRLVNSIALRIRQSLQLQDVLQTTVEEVRQLLQVDRTLIYKFGPGMTGIVTNESVLPQWTACLNSEIQETCFQQNSANKYDQGWLWAVSDIAQAGLTQCHQQLLENFQVKANLVVPILLAVGNGQSNASQNKLWGLLIAHQCDRPRYWQNAEIALLSQLSIQLAIAIQQSEMYERVQVQLYAQVQAELQERQRVAAEFRALVESASDIIFRIDRDLRYLYINPAIEQIVPQASSNWLGKTLVDLGIDSETIALWRELLNRIIFTRTEATIEHPFPTSNSETWCQTRIVPELNPAGKVQSFLCIARDISDRKRSEAALQMQAQILEQIHDAVISTDLNGTIQSWNHGAEELFGYTAKEVIGQNVSILYQDVIELQTKILEPLLVKDYHDLELQCRAKSGTWMDLSLRLSVIRNQQGEIIRLIGCSNDISDRKNMEQELQLLNQELESRVRKRTAQLQESQQFIQSITDNIPNVLYIYDLEQRRSIYSNREVVTTLGYSSEEISKMGSSFLTRLMHPDDLANAAAYFHSLRSVGDGERRVFEYRLRDIHGRWRWFLSHDTPFQRGEDGQVQQIIGIAQDMTERKQIEEQLRYSETQLRMVQRIARLGSWEFDLQTREITWSEEVFRNFGRNPEHGTPTYEELQQLIHPDDRDRHNLLVQRAIEQAQPYSIEFCLYCPDGSLRYLQARGEAVCNENGEVVKLIGTSLDITERKQAEEKLRNLSERLTMAVQSGGFGIWEYNLPQDKLIWDDRMFEIYGVNPSNFSANFNAWVSCLHPDDRVQKLKIMQEVLEKGYEYNTEFRIVQPGGKIRFIKAYGMIQVNEQQEIVRVIGINDDITDLKQAEIALKDSERRYSTLAAAVPVAILRFDVAGNCFYVNDRWSDLTGRPREAALGMEWTEILYQQNREHLLTEWSQWAVTAEGLYHNEGKMVRPDGGEAWFYVQAVAETNSDGAVIGYIGTLTDITARKQAEEKLQQVNERLTLTNAELYRATRLKDEFLANMSHELRTPLNAILGMSQGLQDEIMGVLNDRQKSAIDSIERSGQHLLALINDILDLAKVESGKLELQLEPVGIAYICTSSLSFVQQQAIAKNIQLSIEAPSDLPDIIVDELRIRQVLINLLSNAVKFTPNGGSVKLTVRQEQSDNKNLLCFSVIDTGIGIAQEDVSKLFQPFTQIDSRLNRLHPGTGLGLSLVRRLVQLHQGSITVTSELGQGSCFRVYLPYRVITPSAIAPSLVESESTVNPSLPATLNQKQSSAASSLNQLTVPLASSDQPTSKALILLVEDQEVNALSISSYLEGRGYHWLWAANGQEAITMASTHHPDLILMDIQMPEMDGLEAISRIRADPQLAQIPIIAITALAMPGDEERCLQAGADLYISKPIKLKQLIAVIQKLLSDG
ncbi:two-component hybrid sensor and regulator [Nostoc carneum NIES-2107]|nr:two-component hybrid sensor and regulator [Nostoc carneum NIES-2107]